MFAVLDIECTGLQIGYHEILTSHVIITDGSEIINEQTNNFCPINFRPDYHEAYKIHGITIEQARKFKEKRSSLVSLLDFIPDYSIMVCHSKKTSHYFDYGFLFMEYELIDMRREFYKKFKHCLSTHTLAKKYTKLKNLRLDSLCKEYGIKLNHHDAKSDTYACFELFKMFYENHKHEIDFGVENYG